MGIYLSVKSVRGLRQGLPPGPPRFMDDLEWIRCGLFTIAVRELDSEDPMTLQGLTTCL